MDWTDLSKIGLLGLFVGLVICFALGVIAGLQK